MQTQVETPLHKYQSLLREKDYEPDGNQALVVRSLDRIFYELRPRFRRKNRMLNFLRTEKPVKGLYLWGNVGIGKTWLMDIFSRSFPEGFVLRMHFHRFMQMIHEELSLTQGVKNPLKHVAHQIAKQHGVLCFDEFFVSDITDAMLLGELLKELFAAGITLVTTSNVDPDTLYKGGINRDRFLPAIQMIKEHTEIRHIPSKRDYRFRNLPHVLMYYYPLNHHTEILFTQHFESFTDEWEENKPLIIFDRKIPTVRLASQQVWFDFEALCNIPRSQIDYLEIAKLYRMVFLSNVPQFSPREETKVLYLIKLVDVFYDIKVNLVISAAVPMDELYQEGRLLFEFERTKSRLHEMQTVQYLQEAHR